MRITNRTSGLMGLVAAIALCGTGCVTYTKTKDAPREQVRFTSPTAAQSFYDSYLYVPVSTNYHTVAVWVPMPFLYRKFSTENVRFNKAAALADINHDGVISDEEAAAYAASRHRAQQRS